MTKKISVRPTGAELEILQVLWQNGATTVRDVHERLQREGKNSYTGTLKLMQIMHQKGLLLRDDSTRAHVYAPALPKEMLQREIVSDLLTRVFDGSRSQLVLQALGTGKKASKAELDRIRKLLDQLSQE